MGLSDLKICLSPVKLCGDAIFGKTDILPPSLPPSLPPRGRGTASAGEGACGSLTLCKLYYYALSLSHLRRQLPPGGSLRKRPLRPSPEGALKEKRHTRVSFLLLCKYLFIFLSLLLLNNINSLYTVIKESRYHFPVYYLSAYCNRYCGGT